MAERLFFATYPDAATAEHITAQASLLRHQYHLTGRLIAPERLHVTLAFLGDHPRITDAMISAASAIGDQVKAATFTAALDRVGSFRRDTRRPLVLLGEDGVAGFRDIHGQLGGDLASYNPHLTLLYDDQPVENHFIPAISWRVEEFVLVKSLIGQARHIVLERWPLGISA